MQAERTRRISMELKSVMIFIFVILFLQQFAHSATLVVDGVSEWKNPTVQVGDSIIFRHKYNYNLYIFKSRRAFNLCNFTESTLLTPASPTFTIKWWRACISQRCRFDSHLMQSEALVDNDRRPRETWVGSLSQTSFTGNFIVVPTDGWVTGFSPELVVDSGYSRSTPFVQWVSREFSGLSLLVVKKMWHPSRLGSFYFAFKNESTKSCDTGEKLAIQVSSSPTPEISASPPLPQPSVAAPSPSIAIGGHGSIVSSSPPLPSIPGSGGGIVSSSPSYPWPNRPLELVSPSPSPMNAIFPSNGPLSGPRKRGGSLPFINSNPAVPLPTGEVDSATIRPAPSSSVHSLQDVGLVGGVKVFCCVVLLVVLI